MNLVAISGSLRKGSFNTMLLRALQRVAPKDMKINIVEIGNLPLYNQDDDDAFPSVAQALKETVAAADGIIIATPEYNRSIPGVLKNAIDWVSRPYGHNSFAGKTVLTLGVSVANTGTAVAQSHLKQILTYLDTHVVGQPELYFGPAQGLFDATGNITDASINKLLTTALEELKKRISR